MKFGLVHRVMTDALAALGVLALVASGQFHRTFDVVVTLAMVAAIAMRESWRQAAADRHLDTILTFALVATQLGRIVLAGASVDMLIEFAVGLQIIRVATRKGAAHDQHVIVLALLHLIAGTVVGGGLAYGLCFFGLLVVTPGALVLSHLRREVEGNYRQGARDRTGLPVDVPRILRSKRVVGRQFIAVTCLLSIPILLFTVSLFLMFPRVGLSLLLLNKPKGERMIGFSDKVDLGQIGTLRSDPTIAVRVVIPGLGPNPERRRVFHLRGTALDHYDGRSWKQSHKHSSEIGQAGTLVQLGSGSHDASKPPWRVELEPFEPPVLFLPPTASGIRLAPSGSLLHGSGVRLLRGPEGELRYQTSGDRGVRYDLYLDAKGGVTFTTLRPGNRPRYLQLPAPLPARIRALSAKWTAGVKDDLSRARAIQYHLRRDFKYDLASPSGKFDQPLDHFLFESKRGHCEYFSTAMAVMLRTLGVPARNVTGFVGGTYNKFGNFYAVRQGDAHSWVEAFIEGYGWVTFDPTPPGAAVPQSDIDGVLASVRDFFEAISQRWNRHVVGYDLRQQVSLFESLGSRRGGGLSSAARWPSWRRLLALAGVLLAAASAWWLYRRRRREGDEGEGDADQPSRDATIATNLYQLLDRVMASIGVARGTATPPLRHAEVLLQLGHPLGGEILRVTERYLSARFGSAPLGGEERRDLEGRIRRLKDAPRVGLQDLVARHRVTTGLGDGGQGAAVDAP